jgi:hypothetical protein
MPRHWIEEARHIHDAWHFDRFLAAKHEWLTQRLHGARVHAPGAYPLGIHIRPAMPGGSYRQLLRGASREDANELASAYEDLKRLHAMRRDVGREEQGMTP